ncbi:MAG: zinc ribbon domain-containing protein [Bacillota bacterium]
MGRKYECVKCGSTEYEKGQISTTGGFFSKIFDVQNKKFITIVCKNCGYTEFYAKNTSMAGNIFDFLTS